MYKELIISIIIVVAIVTLDMVLQKYTVTAIEETINDLFEISEQLKGQDVNNQEIVERENQIYERWINYHDKLAYFIEHDELEKVETNFVAAKSYIENEQYDFANNEIAKTIFVLEHIGDKYEFNFENIF